MGSPCRGSWTSGPAWSARPSTSAGATLTSPGGPKGSWVSPWSSATTSAWAGWPRGLGAARGTEDFLFVPIGTGIAAAVVLGGRPRAGAHSLAGEFGHLVVQPDGPACSCGGRGCLETMASAAAIARRYREQAGASPAVGTAEVEALARAGDPVAMGVWQEAISLLGRAFALAQSLLDVDLIVVGGGLANAGERLVGQLQATISPLLPVHDHFRLVLAELGDEASCLGAALLARSSTVAGRHG